MQHSTMSNISDRVHPHCVVCSPFNTNRLQLEFASREDGGVIATFTCGKDLEGYPGFTHQIRDWTGGAVRDYCCVRRSEKERKR